MYYGKKSHWWTALSIHRKISRRRMARILLNKRVFTVLILFILFLLYVFLPVVILRFYDYNYYSKTVQVEKVFGSSATNHGQPETRPILTLISSFKAIESRRKMNENTIKCWAGIPGVIPVMYVSPWDPVELIELAESHGWWIYKAPRILYGLPVLKDMFLHTLKKVDPQTFFVGYANADMLFTKTLVNTLKYLKSLNGSYIQKQGMFITGKRINILMEDIEFDPSSNLLMNIDNEDPDHMIRGNTHTLDYFMFTRTQFPWENVYDFVIGKPGYDNWLTIRAQELGMVTVDGSLTINALHQITSVTDTDKGWLSNDVCVNGALIDPFEYSPGRSSCLKYYTSRSQKSFFSDDLQFLLYERLKFTYFCKPYFDRSYCCKDLAKKIKQKFQLYEVHRFHRTV